MQVAALTVQGDALEVQGDVQREQHHNLKDQSGTLNMPSMVILKRLEHQQKLPADVNRVSSELLCRRLRDQIQLTIYADQLHFVQSGLKHDVVQQLFKRLTGIIMQNILANYDMRTNDVFFQPPQMNT